VSLTEIPGCDPDDPPPPDFTCFQKAEYAGALEIPPPNLAAMLANFGPGGSCPAPPTADPLPLNSWACRTLTEQWGLGSNVTWEQITPSAGPVPVLRSDPDETSYYLQQYMKQVAPNEVWNVLVQEGQQSDPPIEWEPITERFPRLSRVASRDGASQQTQQLATPSVNPNTGGFSDRSAGLLADAPASSLSEVATRNPDAGFVAVRNGHGDYVTPTAASINKAVDAGGDAPLHALTANVPGAYPLVWIDRLYVRTTGLTAEKVEALASMIRYLATDGQEVAASKGEGRLPKALVDEAIAGADRLVEKACPTGSGATIVQSTDPGYAPALPGVQGIGTMKHCQPAATTTTTTAPPATAAAGSGTATGPPLGTTNTPSGASSATPTLAAPLPSTATTTPTQVAAATATAAPTTTTTKPTAQTVVELPLESQGANGFDRLALGTLGAGAFLVLRNPVRRLVRPGL
jgi:hypothetical protein